MTGPAKRPVIFLDRDGTIVDDTHYLARPEDVVLRGGAAHAVRRFNRAGWAVVVITNQSGIARGKLTIAQYESVRDRLDALLAEHGALIDASYYCPHLPELTGPCDCRKPGNRLHRDALRDLSLDATRIVAAGDKWRDVEPVLPLGGRGFLVPSPDTPDDDLDRAVASAETASSLEVVADRVLGAS
jgi:D-glycero-D-manno-heptose 1,7-bisphosphate phosphatase